MNRKILAVAWIWALSLAGVALAPLSAAAQQPDMAAMAQNPVTETARIMFAQASKNLIAASELMAADKYDYRPTPPQMTFGELVLHVGQTNVTLCSALSGAGLSPGQVKASEGKEILVREVKESFTFCGTALSKLTDASLREVVDVGRGKAPRAYVLLVLLSDWSDHYSTAAGYLRLNGLLPPTSAGQAR